MTAAAAIPIGAASPRAATAAFAAGLAAIAGLAAAIVLTGTPNHDLAWILTGTERLIAGGAFGRDVVDVNPPLAWWMWMPPVAAGKALGLGPLGSAVCFTILLALLGVGLARAAIERSPEQLPHRTLFLLFAAAVLMLAPGYNFGQREHLMLIAAFPYAAAAAASASGGRLPPYLAAAIGVFAGLGFCLKPYFLAVPASIELWRWIRGRRFAASFRIENLAIAGTACLYLAAVLVWAPDYLRVVAPEAAATYWAYEGSVLGVGAGFAEALWAVGIAVAILAFMLRRKGASDLAWALLAGSAGAGAAALLQMKGWEYHLLPAVGLGGLACFAAMLSAGAAIGRRTRAAAMLFVLVGTFPIWQHLQPRRGTGGTEGRVERLAALMAAHAGPTGSVFAFATSPRDVQPAVLTAGVSWAGEACCLHHLPARIREAERPEGERPAIRAAAARQLDGLLSRLERERPGIILLENRPAMLGFGERPFEFDEFLRREPRFARLLRAYEDRGEQARFRILVRASGAGS